MLGLLASNGGDWKAGFWEIEKNNIGSFVVVCLCAIFAVSLVIWWAKEECLKARRRRDGNIYARRGSASVEEGPDSHIDQLRMTMNQFRWSPHRFCSPHAFVLWFLYTTAVFAC